MECAAPVDTGIFTFDTITNEHVESFKAHLAFDYPEDILTVRWNTRVCLLNADCVQHGMNTSPPVARRAYRSPKILLVSIAELDCNRSVCLERDINFEQTPAKPSYLVKS